MNNSKLNLIVSGMDNLFHLPGDGWHGEVLEGGNVALKDHTLHTRVVIPADTFNENTATDVVLWVKEHFDLAMTGTVRI